MNSPLVSIIVPIYNVEEYLSKCLDSIINQTYSNLEIILVNDGSTDQSESIIQSFLLKDERIKYIYQINMGPSIARNRGMKEAKGDFICFIDADDFVVEQYIQQLVDKIVEGYDIVTCGYIEVSSYGITELNNFYQSKSNITRDELVDGVLSGVGGALWAKIYRSSIVELNQLELNPNVYMCEDLLFNLEYCFYSKSSAAIQPALYEYNRLNERSITSKIMLDYLENSLVIMQEMEHMLKNLGWSNKKIEVLINQRMNALTLAIANNESSNLMKMGLRYCSTQLKYLLSHSLVQHCLDDYHPHNLVMDIGGYYLKKHQFKSAVISFFLIGKLRDFKLYLKRRSNV